MHSGRIFRYSASTLCSQCTAYANPLGGVGGAYAKTRILLKWDKQATPGQVHYETGHKMWGNDGSVQFSLYGINDRSNSCSIVIVPFPYRWRSAGESFHGLEISSVSPLQPLDFLQPFLYYWGCGEKVHSSSTTLCSENNSILRLSEDKTELRFISFPSASQYGYRSEIQGSSEPSGWGALEWCQSHSNY